MTRSPFETVTTGAPQAEPNPFSKAALFDLGERGLVILLFIHFAYIAISSFERSLDIRSLLLLISETLPVALVIMRKPSASLSLRFWDWIFGLAGTTFPLLIVPAPGLQALAPGFIFYSIIIGGLFLQISAKLSLGTSFGIIAANRGVKIEGPYRFVRHPMYVGYILTHIGLLIAFPSPRNAFLYLVTLAFQIVRIGCEERVLKQDAQYRDFAQRVRYRLFPGVF